MTDAAGRPSRSARRRSERHSQRRRRRRNAGWIALVAVIAVLAALAVGWTLRRGDHGAVADAPAGATTGAPPSDNVTGSSLGAAFTNPPTVATVLLDARAAVQAVDSYDYRSFAHDRSAGHALTTGVFQSGYDQSMSGTVQQHARQNHTVQSCTVQRAGIVSMDSGAQQAVVLVLAVLSVTDSAHPDAQRSPVSLNVTMQRVGSSWLIAAMADAGQLVQSDGTAPGTPDLLAAVAAGRKAVGNLINYRRASFAADFQRSLAGLGPTAAAQQRANESSIKDGMTAGNYDLVGDVVEVAVEDAGFDAATLLVIGDRYQISDDGNRTSLRALRAEVAMTRAGDTWQLAQFTQVGVD
jgi:hypothetical protein